MDFHKVNIHSHVIQLRSENERSASHDFPSHFPPAPKRWPQFYFYHYISFACFWTLYTWNYIVYTLCLVSWEILSCCSNSNLFFSLLCSIPLCDYSTIYLFILLLMDIWFVFNFDLWLIIFISSMNASISTFVYVIFCTYVMKTQE